MRVYYDTDRKYTKQSDDPTDNLKLCKIYRRGLTIYLRDNYISVIIRA